MSLMIFLKIATDPSIQVWGVWGSQKIKNLV